MPNSDQNGSTPYVSPLCENASCDGEGGCVGLKRSGRGMKKTETVYLSHGAISHTEEQLELRERPPCICQGEPQVYVKS